jgi:hypothetical protein
MMQIRMTLMMPNSLPKHLVGEEENDDGVIVRVSENKKDRVCGGSTFFFVLDAWFFFSINERHIILGSRE